MAEKDKFTVQGQVIGVAGPLTSEVIRTEGDIDKQLKLLQLRTLLKQVEKEEQETNEKRRLREQIYAEVRRKEKEVAEIQSRCTHRKINGETAFVGERDHQQRPILICQWCFLIADPATLPRELLPPASIIGGPIPG